MKDKRVMSKPTRNLLIALSALLGVLILMLILRTNKAVCEFVCRYFVNAYQSIAGRIFSFAPYNVFELLAALAAVGAISCIVVSIILFCKKKRMASRQVMLGLLIAVVSVVNLYVFSAGFAYNRKSAPVNAYDGELDGDLAKQTYVALIDDYNAIYDNLQKDSDGCAICPYSEKELREKIRLAVDNALTDKYYYSYTPKAKPITCSGIMGQCHVAGITFLPTAEPGYNKDMAMIEKCSTIAHEFAHSKGVMREDEANIVGTYALLNSNDDYLKYCAYFDIVDDFTHFIPKNEREEFYNKHPYNDGNIAEWKRIIVYWRNKNLLGNIGEFFNDLYLKLNGQQEGIGSYDETPPTDIVDSGNVDEAGDPIYIEVIVDYTKMERMIIGYYKSSIQSGKK